MSDGVNTNRNGADCRRSEEKVTSATVAKAKMASGGGWGAILTPVK